MHKIGIAIVLALAIGGCNRDSEAEVSAASEANLLDEATVNALLGAGISPEELQASNETDANAVGNAAEEPENEE